MKNKGVILSILIICLGALAMFALNLVRNSDKSDTELLEFSIADTAHINKVVIHDAAGLIFTLKRELGHNWTDKDGNCIVQQPANMILKTIKDIEFKGYVPKAARENVKKQMAASSTKVDIYVNDKLTKTWYVGYSTQDHYGTYMLLETPEQRSDLPVIMKIRGMNGIIEPRFFADARRWSCTQVFALQRDQIKEVQVKHFDVPERSFTVKNFGNGTYAVYNEGKTLAQVDTAMIVRYLDGYRKIHYEFDNFELSDKQIDSLKKTQPFCTLKVIQTDGKVDFLKMYRHPNPDGEIVKDDFGDDADYDVNRFWCILTSGKLVKCQYFVFNPLINGHVYFGIDAKKEEETTTATKK